MPSDCPAIAYDKDLFDRRFLDCWRRQALVFMAQAGAETDALLYSAFISTGQVREEILRGEAPKYAFPADCLNDEGLALIGWKQTVSSFDTFEDARATIARALGTSGFAVLMGSTFYFRHNPEYRAEHLNHSIVLTGQAADGSWSIHDDDLASVLRPYRYADREVAAFFDNNGARTVRVFNAAAPPPRDRIHSRARALFDDRMMRHRDDMRLLSDIRAIVTSPHRRPERTARRLRECFSLLSGSRSLTARFLRKVGGADAAAELMDDSAGQALLLRNLMMKAECGGRLNIDRIEARCLALRDTERRVLDHLAKREISA